MNLNLNSKSCMLDSLCIVLGLDPVAAVGLIGHDGSDIGFHSQELIDLADNLGYTTTEIQRFPRGIHPETYETIEIEMPGGNESRFVEHLYQTCGVLMGMKLGRPHAVAWHLDIYTDPANGLSFPLIRDGKLIDGVFDPMVFLRLNQYE